MTNFEQPVNEQVRVCLRIEHLLKKANYFLSGTDQWDSMASLQAINDLVILLDRPDLRSKLSKESSRQLSTLRRLQQSPGVNLNKLDQVIRTLEHINASLHGNKGKFAHPLRENEFLSSIRQHQYSPGASCSFNTPDMQSWLAQAPQLRRQDLTQWMGQFEDVKSIVSTILSLIRESGVPVSKTAEQGFYQMALDPQMSCQLVRVSIAENMNVFPQISVGRHALNIRFNELNLKSRAVQSTQDIPFELTCCIL